MSKQRSYLDYWFDAAWQMLVMLYAVIVILNPLLAWTNWVPLVNTEAAIVAGLLVMALAGALTLWRFLRDRKDRA